MATAPVLSLITGKVERDQSFQRLVDSIVKNTTTPWELIVVDASLNPYRSDDQRIRVIHEQPRQTHTLGYNRGFSEAVGSWLIWLNDDSEVCEGYDSEAIAFMERYPQIGLGALHYCDPGEEFHVNSAWGCIYANFGIFHKAVGEAIGWFDPSLNMYGADNSIALRMLMVGKGVADIPKARIIHHSVKDKTRDENQRNRATDNRTLTKKYMPFIKQWQRTFRELQVHTGTVPWSHGIKPELVKV